VPRWQLEVCDGYQAKTEVYGGVQARGGQVSGAALQSCVIPSAARNLLLRQVNGLRKADFSSLEFIPSERQGLLGMTAYFFNRLSGVDEGLLLRHLHCREWRAHQMTYRRGPGRRTTVTQGATPDRPCGRLLPCHRRATMTAWNPGARVRGACRYVRVDISSARWPAVIDRWCGFGVR
jgi:hypothetical protein